MNLKWLIFFLVLQKVSNQNRFSSSNTLIFLHSMKKNLPLIVILALLLLYIVGSTNNSTLDAWAYANDIEHAQNLLKPHHLLYNVAGFTWVKLSSWLLPLDTLQLLKLMNAIFATAALFVLYKILQQLKVCSKIIPWLLLFAGASWGVLRFSTDNETYIVPIVFSLLGSHWLIKAINTNCLKRFIVVGLFAAIATLFHQVMFFWWIALLIGLITRRKIKPIVAYALPAAIVPITYAIATYIEVGSFSITQLVDYTLSDYQNGAAQLSINSNCFVLEAINLVRSFVQGHGYIAILLNKSTWWWIGGISAMLLIFAGILFITNKCTKHSKFDFIFGTHLLALVLHIIFSTLSSGNAEFLVMTPFLLVILISYFNLNHYGLALLASGILIWNTVFGIVPLKYWALDGSSMVVNHVVENGNPCSVYILHNKPRIENELNYKNNSNGSLLLKAQELSSVSIDTMLHNGYNVYIDVFSRPQVFSQEYFVGEKYNPKELLDGLVITPVTSENTLCGKFWLYRVVR